MGVKRGIVELEEYNSKWVDEFNKERDLLKKILKDKVIAIEHVGSTSIPGLKSKPIIDICVAIENLEDAVEFEKILEPYDYHFRGHQGVPDRYFYAKGPEENRTHYIHFEQIDSNSYKNHLLFKKYLINHPEYIEKYQNIKEKLALKYPEERKKYTAGKSDFIVEVIKLAEQEYND